MRIVKICYNCGNYEYSWTKESRLDYCQACGDKLHKLNFINQFKLTHMSRNDKDAWIEQQTGLKISDELKQQRSHYIKTSAQEARERVQRSREAEAAAKQLRMNPTNIHCPTCGSNKIERISGISRAASVGMLGLASSKIGKTFECKNCGYKW